MKKYILIIGFLNFLCCYFYSFSQENIHQLKINQYDSILNTSIDNNQLMKASIEIAKEYIDWNKKYDAIRYYKKSIVYADRIKHYNYQNDLRIRLSQLYVETNNYREAINILNEALNICVKNDKKEDADKVQILLEKYFQQIGDDQENIINQRKELLKKLSNIGGSNRIQNEDNAKLKSRLNEVISLKNQIERSDEELKQLNELLAVAQKSIQDNSKNIQDLQVKLLEKEATIKNQKSLIYAGIILLFILCAFLMIVILKNLTVRKQKKQLIDQKFEIEKRTLELKIQNNEIENQAKELKLKNKENEEQACILKNRNEELNSTNEELNSLNEELNSTLEYLKKTQKQLIQREQMASLGKLMAGIAHEINTPLGAINSSIEAVLSASEKNKTKLRELVKKIPDEQFQIFTEIIDDGIKGLNHYTSTTEERSIKANLKNQLHELGISNNSKLSNELVNIGIHEIKEEYIKLLKSKDIDLIMQTAYNLHIQFRNGYIIKDAVEKASKVIKALKFYSFTRNGEEMVLSDIIQSIESVLTLYHNQLKHKIKIEKIFSEIPQILCYPDLLSQVWSNLIRNSIQAISENGIIQITIKIIDHHIEILFSDNGCGIPENIRDKIFDPFFTTKAAGEGTGLGLDIIKKIIEKHDGEISFESIVDKGTTFKVILPIKI